MSSSVGSEYIYTFRFLHDNPTQQVKQACNALLASHNVKLAINLGQQKDSGVVIVTQTKARMFDNNARATMGIPVLCRMTTLKSASYTINEEIIKGEPHQIHSMSFDLIGISRRIRKKNPKSGEPIVIHTQKRKIDSAFATIDWSDKLLPKLFAQISYYRDYDRLKVTELQDIIKNLEETLFLKKLKVTFPEDIEQGAVQVKLDLFIEQGAIDDLRKFARKNRLKFITETHRFLREFLFENKTELNMYRDNPRKAQKALEKTMKKTEKMLEHLMNCRPKKHRSSEFSLDKKADVYHLGKVINIMAKNPLVLIGIKKLRADLVKYHYVLRGEKFNPYELKF